MANSPKFVFYKYTISVIFNLFFRLSPQPFLRSFVHCVCFFSVHFLSIFSLVFLFSIEYCTHKSNHMPHSFIDWFYSCLNTRKMTIHKWKIVQFLFFRCFSLALSLSLFLSSIVSKWSTCMQNIQYIYLFLVCLYIILFCLPYSLTSTSSLDYQLFRAPTTTTTPKWFYSTFSFG